LDQFIYFLEVCDGHVVISSLYEVQFGCVELLRKPSGMLYRYSGVG
jgi:hypothetical protein